MIQLVNWSVDGFEFFQVPGDLFYYEALYRHGFFHPFALEVEIVAVEFMPHSKHWVLGIPPHIQHAGLRLLLR